MLNNKHFEKFHGGQNFEEKKLLGQNFEKQIWVKNLTKKCLGQYLKKKC
jgi:hypothetical protein